MLVDDEEFNLLTLEELLEDEDYEVLTANDGADALRLLREHQEAHRIKLIISDQRMPNMTGTEFLEGSLDIIPTAKRILLTGYSDTPSIIDAINRAQVFKYVNKPFDHEDLMLTVRRAVEAYDLEIQNRSLVSELQSLNAELEERVRKRTAELHEAMVELRSANATKDKMFSIIAHDLKNPFTGMLGSTKMLAMAVERMTPEQIKELSVTMHRSAERFYGLLLDLLNWAAVQVGRMEPTPGDVAVREVVQPIVDLLLEPAAKKEIELRLEVPDELVTYADRNLISAVVRNLMFNALKFSSSGQSVTVRGTIDGDTVRISVVDTGVGIAPERIDSLFRPGTDVSTDGTAAEKGTGLGLLLCKEFAELCGGTLEVESEIGKGTTFHLLTPRSGVGTAAAG